MALAPDEKAQMQGRMDQVELSPLLGGELAKERMLLKTIWMVADAGKLRVEGKDYVVIDGEVLEIRFNV